MIDHTLYRQHSGHFPQNIDLMMPNEKDRVPKTNYHDAIDSVFDERHRKTQRWQVPKISRRNVSPGCLRVCEFHGALVETLTG